MSNNAEILLEGSYLYYQKEVNYSQENFKLIQLPDQQSFQVYSEILSRVETGEFLKLLVRYEMTQNFIPFFMRIEKSIGNKYVVESYKYDLHSQELHYTFQTPQKTQEFTKPHSAKHYLTSPAFATSTLFTLSRKFDPTGRTSVTFVRSHNDWTYEGPPADKLVYAEFKSRDLADFKLNNNTLSASHLCLYEHDSIHSLNEKPVDIFISKHYAIPYQLIHGDMKIVIKNLKKNN